MITKFKNIILKIIYILIFIYLLIFVPSFFGHKPLVVISGSMESTLKVGGILYYSQEDLDNFKKGDILVYKKDKHIISHRIVSRQDNCFITKGDANNTVDSSLVQENQILGKGTNWSIPYIGYYANFIYTHKYILFLSVMVIIVDLTYDLYKKRKDNIENEKEIK